MKIKWLLALILFMIPVCSAQEPKKLYVSLQYESPYAQFTGINQVLFIEDLETGTRCYAVSNHFVGNYNEGFAIACVPKH